MTVNERLFHLGLVEAFAAAAKARDFESLVRILTKARLSPFEAEQSARSLLSDPARYGF
jgi:hypothetical protein